MDSGRSFVVNDESPSKKRFTGHKWCNVAKSYLVIRTCVTMGTRGLLLYECTCVLRAQLAVYCSCLHFQRCALTSFVVAENVPNFVTIATFEPGIRWWYRIWDILFVSPSKRTASSKQLLSSCHFRHFSYLWPTSMTIALTNNPFTVYTYTIHHQ